MDSPSEYLSDNDSAFEEYESGIEDVTNKITAKKEKPIKLSFNDDDGDGDGDGEDDDEDDDIEDDDVDIDDDEIVDKSNIIEDLGNEDIEDEDIDTDKQYYNNEIDENANISLSDDSDDDYDDDYYEKIDSELKQDYIIKYHSNLLQNNYDEIETLSKITGLNKYGITDELHKTVPILTKYEKARILGLRAKQLENGSLPLIELDKSIIDPYLIAIKELEQKKIPFIIKRPLPNGACEYWKIKDLELLL